MIKKSLNSKGKGVAVRFLLKKQIFLDPKAEVLDEVEINLLFYQVNYLSFLKLILKMDG